MQIRPEITCTITDDVTTLLGLCIARVNQLEGTTKKEAFIYNRYIAVIDIKEDVANILIVDQPQRGFISYPRSGTLKTAAIPGTDKNMTPTYMIVNTGNGFNIDEAGVIVDLGAGGLVAYPVDQAYAGNSWVFLDNGDSTWNVKGGAKDYYGNVDWKGPATSDPTKRKILSYFGNPSRYWPIGQFISVPNLTTIDHTIESLTGDYSYTTVFRPYVFEAGTIKAIMPPLYAPMNSSIQRAQVLGAAYRESDEKLVCIVKTCYNTYPRGKAVGEMVSTWQVFNGDTLVLNFLEDKAKATEFAATSNEYTLKEVPDPGRGYWVEVLLEKAGDVEGGWTRLLRIPVNQGMPNTNWFFSENGTQAVTVMYGKLHLITISGTSATYTTQELGEFKNTIKTTKVTKQEDNPGEPDPAAAGGIFSNVYRVGIESGDWIGKTENTNKYTSIKSGTRILCADFKGNELVKLTSTLSGAEEYNYYRLFGMKWGQTALPGNLWNDVASRWLKEPAVHQNMNGLGSLISPSVAGSACKPKCDVTVQNMVLHQAGASGTGCDDIYRIEGCTSGSLAQACITTTTKAANGTASRTDCVRFATGGTWVEQSPGKLVSQTGYGYEYPVDDGTVTKRTRRYVTMFYQACGNFPSAEAREAWAQKVFASLYAPDGWMGIESVGDCPAGVPGTTDFWVGVYYETELLYLCP